MQNSTIEVLVIEDNLAEAEFIGKMLTKAPMQRFSVQHTEYLADALGLLERQDFDVVLVDLGLPDCQGLETALRVREHSKGASVIIVLTSLDDEALALQSLHMGIQDYLVKKEINDSLLRRSIRYAIQRKRDIEALRESEQRFTSFMFHLPAAAWMKDLDGRYVYANAEAERIFTMPLVDLQGKSDEDLFPPETARQFRENDERVLTEGGSLRATEVLHQADGTEQHSIVSKFAITGPNGQPKYVAGVAFDITDRTHMEEALRESEEKFFKIFDVAPVAITISTLAEGRFVDINREGERLSGYRRDEVIGHSLLEFYVWKNAVERAKIIEEIRKEGVVRDREMTFRDKKGNVVLGSYSAAVIDIRGKKHVLSIVSDITDRKHAEEEIKRLNVSLMERSIELEASNRELEAFNYSAAHDLRQPLNAIGTCCQAIEMRCDLLSEEGKDYVRQVYEGTFRMSGLIDALLKFSLMGRVELHREEVDLSALAHEVIAMLKSTEPERQADFRVGDGIRARADASLLRVVLDNLLGNAWKYTGLRELPVIEFGVTQSDGKQVFFVRDNGAGFDMADGDKLFVPFQRLAGAEKFRGFGIGLATVERIILRHGGRIWAEAETGKGASFYFTLSER